MWLVSKGRYEDLKAAHKREVDILVTWIEQLQTQLNVAQTPRTPEAPKKVSEVPGMSMYISADEEDLIDAHAQGLIDDAAFQQGMDELGRAHVEIG
jgi:hypothetical protein